jgi:hypothetical protein
VSIGQYNIPPLIVDVISIKMIREYNVYYPGGITKFLNRPNSLLGLNMMGWTKADSIVQMITSVPPQSSLH